MGCCITSEEESKRELALPQWPDTSVTGSAVGVQFNAMVEPAAAPETQLERCQALDIAAPCFVPEKLELAEAPGQMNAVQQLVTTPICVSTAH